MLRTFLLSLTLLAGPAARAQYDDLLRNTDVVWVAEYTTDYLMNPADEKDAWESPLNFLHPIRLQHGAAVHGLIGIHSSQRYLSEQMFRRARQPGFQGYVDSSLQHLLSAGALATRLVKIDTVTTSSDNLYEGEFRTIRNDYSASDISAFRVQQVFWYDARRRQFGSRLLAYAPVYDVRDNEGNWLHWRRPFFWLPGAGKSHKSRKGNRYAYIFQTNMVENSPGLRDFRVLKGSLDVQQLVGQEIAHPAHQWLNASTYQPIDTAEMAAVCFGADTVRRYVNKAEGFELTVEPWNRVREIEKIGFVQNWYFDERQHRLYSQLVGWAPLSTVRGKAGAIRYYERLFYQMYR